MPDLTPYPPLLDPQFLHRLEQLELVSRKIFSRTIKGERRSKRTGRDTAFRLLLVQVRRYNQLR